MTDLRGVLHVSVVVLLFSLSFSSAAQAQTDPQVRAYPPGRFCLLRDAVSGSPERIVEAIKGAGFAGLFLPPGRADAEALRAGARQSGLEVIEQAASDRMRTRVSLLSCAEKRVRGGRSVTFDLNDELDGPLVCALAGRLKGRDAIVPSTLTDLENFVSGATFTWTPPEGTWLLLFFFAVEEVPDRSPAAGGPFFTLSFSGARKLFWSDDFPRRYQRRFGEPFDRKQLAGLSCRVGPQTGRFRWRLRCVSQTIREENLKAMQQNGSFVLPADKPYLPFLIPAPYALSLPGWSSPATSVYYSWSVRAAASLFSGEAPLCLLPPGNNWAVLPSQLRFHLDLAWMWGAKAAAFSPFLPDRLHFPVRGEPAGIPAWFACLPMMTRYRPVSRAAEPAADVCIAVSKAGLTSEGRLGYGPAIASALAASCRDFHVTSLQELAEHAVLREGMLLVRNNASSGGGDLWIKAVIVPVHGIIQKALVNKLIAWARGGVACVCAGSLPRLATEAGTAPAELALLFKELGKEPGFFHAQSPQAVVDHLETQVPAPLQVHEGTKGAIHVRQCRSGGHALYFLLNTSDRPWRGSFLLPGERSAANVVSNNPFMCRKPVQKLIDGGLLVELSFGPRSHQELITDPKAPCFRKKAEIPLKTPWRFLPLCGEGDPVKPCDAGRFAGSDGSVRDMLLGNESKLSVRTVFLFENRPDPGMSPSGLLEDAVRFDVQQDFPAVFPHWRGWWITGPEQVRDSRRKYLRDLRLERVFHLSRDAAHGSIALMARGGARIVVNKFTARIDEPETLFQADVTHFLKPGYNRIEVQLRSPAHFLFELAVRMLDGKKRVICSDHAWQAVSGKKRAPAALLGRPAAEIPGPFTSSSDATWCGVPVPAGACSMSIPENWRYHGVLGESTGLRAVRNDHTIFFGNETRAAFVGDDRTICLFAIPPAKIPPPVFTFQSCEVQLGELKALGLEDFSGTLRYETQFVVPEGNGPAPGQRPPAPVLFDLGEAGFFVTLAVDGKVRGGSFAPPHCIAVDGIAPGAHTLQLFVTTLSAPRRLFRRSAEALEALGLRRNSILRRAEALRSGLSGPVRAFLLERISE